MSDLVEDGDGTPVRVSDLCALMLSTGQPGVREYLVDVLEAFSGDRAYRLDLVFGDLSGGIGDGHGTPSVSAEAEVPVTTGGTLLARLSLYGS